MTEMNYKILVDSRESHTNSETADMIPKLIAKKLPYEKTTLNVGDYILKNLDNGIEICIERKIIPDLISSIYDGRWEKEMLQMENNYNRSFVIVVGKWEDYYKQQAKLVRMKVLKFIRPFSVNQRLGILASLNARYNNVRLIQVDNDEQFLNIIVSLLDKCSDGKKLGEEVMIQRKAVENIYLNILTSFPKVGLDKAKRIVEKYPTFKTFFESLENNSFEVDGIGDKTLSFFKEELLGVINEKT